VADLDPRPRGRIFEVPAQDRCHLTL